MSIFGNIFDKVKLYVGDVKEDTFNKSIYKEVIGSAIKKIIGKYNVNRRSSDFTFPEILEQYTLNIEDFKSEYQVVLNDTYSLTKVREDHKLSDYQYQIIVADGSIAFDYQPKVEDDTIRIYYTTHFAHSDYNVLDDSDIPEDYHEEIVSLAIQELVKIALARYSEEVQVAKWSRIAQMHNINPDSIDHKKVKDPWIQVKLWSPF